MNATTTELPETTTSVLPEHDRPRRPAFSLKTILVPVDFSPCSRKALEYALALARQHGSTIALLYVAPIPSYAAAEFGGLDYTRLDGLLRDEGTRKLAALRQTCIPADVPAACHVRVGPPDALIVEAASDLAADLIVISTHGHTGLKHVLLGSVSEHVVRRASCPVLVVREREHEFLTP